MARRDRIEGQRWPLAPQRDVQLLKRPAPAGPVKLRAFLPGPIPTCSLFSSLFPGLRCHILDLYRTPSGGGDAETLSIRLAPDMSGEIRVRAWVVASRGRRFTGYRSRGEIWVFGTSAIRRMRGAKPDPDTVCGLVDEANRLAR
jgi:hypothetical protein